MTFSTYQLFSQKIIDSLKSQLADTVNYKNNPVYILNRRTNGSVETTNIVLNMLDVDSINVFTRKTPGIYGDKAKNNLIEFNIKNIAPLVNFDEFCAIYNLSDEDQKLPFFIDSIYAYKPRQTYFELGDVVSVKISTEKSSNMKYVNIRTLFPKLKNITDL